MSKFKVEVDSEQIDRILSQLSQEKVHDILLTAVKEGGKALKKSTWDNLLSTRFHVRGSRRNFQKYIKQKNNDIYSESTISIGSFLWWFEKGTAERKQKKTGRRTGRITGENFFRKSQQDSKTYIEPIIKSIEKSLSKIV